MQHVLYIMPQSHCAESVPERGRMDHLSLSGVSFLVIPIHSNCILLIRVGLAGEYESFEHIQKLRVASTNKFHSCLTH